MSMNGMWPFRHLGLKLLSVVLAVLLWLVIGGEQTTNNGLRRLRTNVAPPGN